MFKFSRENRLVLESSKLAQSLISELHASDPSNAIFEQVGLLGGGDIVKEFLDHGELGCALNHVLYMVHESEIVFPRDRLERLHDLAENIGEPSAYNLE